MFTFQGKIYSDPYHYLYGTVGGVNFVAFQAPAGAKGLGEREMKFPIEAIISGKLVKWEGGLLAACPEAMTYSSIKTQIIKSRYSNDDQIAIILNKDNSEEDILAFNRMQSWRNMATDIAKSAINITDIEFEELREEPL